MLSIGFSFIGIPSVSAQISGGDDLNPAVVHLINKVKNGKDSYFNSFVQAGLTSSHYTFRDYKGNQVYNYIIRNMTTDSFSDKNAIVKSEVFSLSSDYQKLQMQPNFMFREVRGIWRHQRTIAIRLFSR